jgi:hypothetical protein
MIGKKITQIVEEEKRKRRQSTLDKNRAETAKEYPNAVLYAKGSGLVDVNLSTKRSKLGRICCEMEEKGLTWLIICGAMAGINWNDGKFFEVYSI